MSDVKTSDLHIDRLLVVLTGGIATGKSSVAQRLRQHGIDVVDTDTLAHALTAPSGAALPLLRNAFGDDVFCPDGTLDRKALRERVFHDATQKALLEQILHPLIRHEALKALASATSSYIVADVPLFAETGFLREQADRVLVVDCPPETQKQRLMARAAGQGLDETLADLILQAQAPRATRLALATEIIDNSHSPQERDQQVDTIHQHYLALVSAHKKHGETPLRV